MPCFHGMRSFTSSNFVQDDRKERTKASYRWTPPYGGVKRTTALRRGDTAHPGKQSMVEDYQMEKQDFQYYIHFEK